MTHIDVFDPPMCCSSGVCGPSVDPLPAAFVTLPEATPIHEALQLERDLACANITPFAWVVNQSLTPLDVTDPALRARRSHEAVHLRELAVHGRRTALEPWLAEVLAADPVGA